MLQAIVRSLDRSVVVGRVQALDTLLEESLSQPRFRTVLAVLFAVLALALTLGGVYGSVSFAVTQRTREFGIRSALGALPRQLLAMVLRQGMWVVSLGAGLGFGGAVIGGRLVRDLLYDTRPFEPTVVVGVIMLLAAFAVVAMIAPAARAGRIDPAVTLRTE
jgi:putative ABC transport system permease protein